MGHRKKNTQDAWKKFIKPRTYATREDNAYGIGAGATKTIGDDFFTQREKSTYSARPGGGDSEKQFFIQKGKPNQFKTKTRKISEKRYNRITKRWSEKA